MGQYEYGLKSLADDQLLSGLASIVHRRNQITAEFLAYLAELDERQLFLDLGYSSLFEYCVKTLRLCESTAGRHIAAARVCRNHPEAFEMVASGKLHASALSSLKKHLTMENAAELFELCADQSARTVEELLGARFPRADVRDLVRRLPARTGGALDVGCSAESARMKEPSRAPFGELQTMALARRETSVELSPAAAASNELQARVTNSTVESLSLEPVAAGSVDVIEPRRVASRSAMLRAVEASKSRRVEPLSADRYGVHFTADGEFCALLERVRGLAGHRLPNGDLMTLLKRGLEAYERELEKQRFAVGSSARRNRSKPDPSKLDPSEPDPSKPDPSKPDPSKPDPSKPDPSKPDPSKPDPSKPDSSKPDPSKPDSSKPDSSKPDSSKPDSSKPDSSKPDLPKISKPDVRSELRTMDVPRPGGTKLDPPLIDVQSTPCPVPKRKSRPPAAVVRAVFLRDGKRCSYVSPDGRRCAARRCLEIDHIEPRAVGGEDAIANLRLRCRAHNQRYARQYFGAFRVAAAIQNARRWRATRG